VNEEIKGKKKKKITGEKGPGDYFACRKERANRLRGINRGCPEGKTSYDRARRTEGGGKKGVEGLGVGPRSCATLIGEPEKAAERGQLHSRRRRGAVEEKGRDYKKD